jgi:hypothetical protein
LANRTTITQEFLMSNHPADRFSRELEAFQSISRIGRHVGFVKVRRVTAENAPRVYGDLRAKLSPAGIQLTVQPAAEPHAHPSTKP